MTGLSLAVLIGLGYSLSVLQGIPDDTVSQIRRSHVLMQSSPKPNQAKRLRAIAASITVRVMAKTGGGSGTLVQKRGSVYTVLTNRHVLTSGSPYWIQTPDGRTHPATLLKQFDFEGNDLAILRFHSDAAYAIATLGRAQRLTIGDRLVSAGFPLEDSTPAHKFLLTTGQVSLLPRQALEGGYQIGYTNQIYKGMSGGPVLNTRGELVGINSLHAYPLWGNPYIYQDGSHPQPKLRQAMAQSSWAVPIETALCLTLPLFELDLSRTSKPSHLCYPRLKLPS